MVTGFSMVEVAPPTTTNDAAGPSDTAVPSTVMACPGARVWPFMMNDVAALAVKVDPPTVISGLMVTGLLMVDVEPPTTTKEAEGPSDTVVPSTVTT
jgi:hypothetical protein